MDLGTAVADWIERNLVHGEGDYYGEPFRLAEFQRELLRRLYLVDADTGQRVVRRALLIGPKGWGKTELLAAVGLAELAGPTALAPGGTPTGRKSPNVPVAAASYEQSDRLFAAAQIMATHERSGIAPFLEVGETEIRLRGRPGRLFRVAAVGGTNEGGLPTAFIADEVHEWRLPRQERVHLVIGNSLSKRAQGLELNITTPDDARPDSLLGRMVAYGEQVAAGEVVDPTYLYVRYSAPPDADLSTPEGLRAAIAEATPAPWVDVERVAARLEIDHIPEHEFRRYHLGQFVRPEGTWLDPASWSQLERATEVPAGSRVVLGFDGSYDHTSAGLVVCSVDGALGVLLGLERSEDAPEDWRVPLGSIDAAIADAFARFKVLELVCDPARWANEIEAWEERYGDVVVPFPSNSPKRMGAACARFYAAVGRGELSHDGDPALARHLHNAVLKETPDGAYIVRESRESPRRITLATAAVLAYDRAMWHATQQPARPMIF